MPTGVTENPKPILTYALKLGKHIRDQPCLQYSQKYKLGICEWGAGIKIRCALDRCIYQIPICPYLPTKSLPIISQREKREEEKNFKNDAAEKTFGMIVKVEKDSRNFAIAYCSANSIDAFCSFHKTRQPKGHNL